MKKPEQKVQAFQGVMVPGGGIEPATRGFPSLQAAALHFGINPGTAKSRNKMGWSWPQTFELEDRKRPIQEGRQVTYQGVTYINLTEFANAFNVSKRIVESRIANGATPEEAIQPNKLWVTFSYQGKDYFYPSLAAAAREAGIKSMTLRARLKSGWSYPQAMGWEPR